MKKDFEWKKKQVYKKYKHRAEFKNADGNPITSKKEFRDAQIRLVQNPDTYVSKAVHISKDHDPQDCYLFIDDGTRQVVEAKLNPNSDSLEYERFKRHGVIG